MKVRRKERGLKKLRAETDVWAAKGRWYAHGMRPGAQEMSTSYLR